MSGQWFGPGGAPFDPHLPSSSGCSSLSSSPSHLPRDISLNWNWLNVEGSYERERFEEAEEGEEALVEDFDLLKEPHEEEEYIRNPNRVEDYLYVTLDREEGHEHMEVLQEEYVHQPSTSGSSPVYVVYEFAEYRSEELIKDDHTQQEKPDLPVVNEQEDEQEPASGPSAIGDIAVGQIEDQKEEEVMMEGPAPRDVVGVAIREMEEIGALEDHVEQGPVHQAAVDAPIQQEAQPALEQGEAPQAAIVAPEAHPVRERRRARRVRVNPVQEVPEVPEGYHDPIAVRVRDNRRLRKRQAGLELDPAGNIKVGKVMRLNYDAPSVQNIGIDFVIKELAAPDPSFFVRSFNGLGAYIGDRALLAQLIKSWDQDTPPAPRVVRLGPVRPTRKRKPVELYQSDPLRTRAPRNPAPSSIATKTPVKAVPARVQTPPTVMAAAARITPAPKTNGPTTRLQAARLQPSPAVPIKKVPQPPKKKLAAKKKEAEELQNRKIAALARAQRANKRSAARRAM